MSCHSIEGGFSLTQFLILWNVVAVFKVIIIIIASWSPSMAIVMQVVNLGTVGSF